MANQDGPVDRGLDRSRAPIGPARGWRRIQGAVRAHPARSVGAALVLLAGLALVFADALLAGPMRTRAEQLMNSKLNGYTVRITRVHPHIWRLGVDLDELVLVQNRHRDPPVADFGALQFGLAWSELLHFRVAGDLTLVRPALHINLAQNEQEARSQVSMKDQGWQGAVESIYPIKLDQVRIRDGSLLYLSGRGGDKPLQLTKVTMLARNVRNAAAAGGTFPSPVTLEGALFDTGRIRFKGAADFLREPYAAAQGQLSLVRVPLDRLAPLAQDYQLKTTSGLLSLDGTVEYTPELQVARLRQVLFENLRLDYVTSKATAGVEAEHARQAEQVARQLRNAPRVILQMDSLRMTHGQIGFVNQATRPPYRVFISEVDLKLDNLSNQATQGRSAFTARGAFMGSGATVASGGFRSTARPVDFDVQLRLDDARLTDLNPLLLAYSGVDVADGRFSLYTEITVKNGQVEGYLKPLIKDLKIYDPRKDQGKTFGKRVEMHLLQWVAAAFKNRRTQDVATVARLSGPTGDPKASEWEVIRRLIGNGFAKAILPGFMAKAEAAKGPGATGKTAPPSH